MLKLWAHLLIPFHQEAVGRLLTAPFQGPEFPDNKTQNTMASLKNLDPRIKTGLKQFKRVDNFCLFPTMWKLEIV